MIPLLSSNHFSGDHDDIKGIAEPCEHLAQPGAFLTLVARIGCNNQQVDIAVAAHLSCGRQRSSAKTGQKRQNPVGTK
jgi:hypothetical protein